MTTSIARSSYFVAGTVVLLLAATQQAGAQVVVPTNPSDHTVLGATNVLVQTMTLQSGIPQRLLAEAQGLVIVPNMVRGAFVIGVQHGRGVLLARNPQGAWQPPRFIQITGGSIGYQIGVQSTDLILVFRSQQSVANLMAGTLKIGVDASAAAGPVGRQTSASTDLQLQAEILSYSRARGAFVGVSIDGSVISLDPTADAMYYQPAGTMPASAVQLLQYVTAYSGGGSAPPPPAAVAAVPAAPGDIEAVRQQLDAVSRQLAANLDDNWKSYLALPPELYIPNQMPSPQVLQQAIARYEDVSRRPEYAALQARPEFQETLRLLWKFGELQTSSSKPFQLPPPPQ